MKSLNPLYFSADLAGSNSNTKNYIKKIRIVIKATRKENNSNENFSKLKILKYFAENLRKNYVDTTLLKMFISWKRKLRRGVIAICLIRSLKIASLIKIQKTWKKYHQQQKFRAILTRIIYIQRYWKFVRPLRKRFIKSRYIAKMISNIVKNINYERNASAILIQQSFSKLKANKMYQPTIKANLTKINHEKLLQRQQLLIKDRNRKKRAVRIIEK